MGFGAAQRSACHSGRGVNGRAARTRSRRRGSRNLLLFACGSLIAVSAHAQAVPQQPLAPTREEIERRDPGPAELPPARLTVEGGLERAPCALDRPEYRDITFTVSDVIFENLRGLSAEDLRPAYADYLGREVPISAICDIRDRAATMLRDAGYVASVEVPEQRIADGTVRFRVLMARLVGLRVRGDAGRAERLIASYLEPLTEQEVFNRQQAERYLLLAGDLPGYTVRMALRSAAAEPGDVIGEVTVMRLPAVIELNVQNYGSRELGRWGGLIRGQFFGLTGLGDRTSLTLFSTADVDEQQTVQLAHDFRLGGEGLALGGQVTYAWARPDLGDPNLDIEAETLFATAEASFPFVRRQAQTVIGSVGLDFIDQDVDFNDLPLSRDRLRVGFARLGFQAIDLDSTMRGFSIAAPRWRMGGTLELRQGLDILGASEGCGPNLALCTGPGMVPPSRLEGDPTATLVRGAVQGEYRPSPKLTFAVGARAQYSGDALLSFEEFAAGNYTIGRGYDPGTLLGDRGLALQGEIRFGSTIPSSADGIAAEPYLFIDQAWVWNEDQLLAAPGRQEVTSLGGGVRAAWGDRVRVDVLFAWPLDSGPLQQEIGDPRLLVSLTTRLLPWSF